MTGHLGQLVKLIVRCQDTETVTIHIQKMEDLTVRVAIKRKKIALEEDVKLMEVGEVGLLGQAVKVIVQCHNLEAAIIQLLKMEVQIVRVTGKK